MDNIPYKQFHSLTFGVYTAAAIRKLSILEVTKEEPFDSLEHPTPGGLHDLRLGTTERDEKCETCGLYAYYCPGHFGHIEFPLPICNPVLINALFQLLQGMCFTCNRLLAPLVAKKLVLYQLQALDYGLIETVQKLAECVADPSVTASKDAPDSLVSIENNLKKVLREATDGLDLKECRSASRVKAVKAYRDDIIKGFIRAHLTSSKKKCPHCNDENIRLALRKDCRIVFTSGKRTTKVNGIHLSNRVEDMNEHIMGADDHSSTIVTPLEAKKHIDLLWTNEKPFLEQLFKILNVPGEHEECPVDVFFIEALLVPPPKFRSVSEVKGRKYLSPKTAALKDVLSACLLLRNIIKSMKGMQLDKAEQDAVDGLQGNSNLEKVHFIWHKLQNHVNGLYDSNMDKFKIGKGTSGCKQVLEKKTGLFRQNMMGKRVNYAARSVISPDPYIKVDEIGVPEVFAKKLTYPSPVTDWNVEKLRAAVFNGPNVYPGAEKVEYEDKRVVRLSSTDYLQRHAIACKLLTPPPNIQGARHGIPKIVHRHMQDGDIVLMNRQPTLHKPSIMGHKARILPGEKTLRLHYANCKTYNADFDGDEMNLHFPQGEVARSEGYNIASVNHQYLVPKDGTPLSGLIQDHIIAGTLFTIRGRFFSWDEYCQLVFNALPSIRKAIKTLPPCIMKPKQLWSGKQIVSTVILNLLPKGQAPINMDGKAKIPAKNWQKEPAREWLAGGTPLVGESMSESEVIIRSGELLCGVLDKGSVGPTPYGFIHCCYELYGGETSSALLSAFGRLFTHFLQTYAGFSLGIEDILLTDKAEKKRKKIIRKAKGVGDIVSAQAFDVDDVTDKEELQNKYRKAHLSRDDIGLKMLDFEMKKETDSCSNDINRICMPSGLMKKFPNNNMQLMVQSGAKGTMVNAMQISCLLGQIELEGRRVPLMSNGSSLPSFLPYDTSPRAGGFVNDRFLTGLRPQEYFFHCMAGREGLIDTAVKTSRSGYLQRCLAKHLEGISVNYDLTVRDSDGSLIEVLYGEDGLDIMKIQMLKENHLDFLAKNYEAVMSNAKSVVMQYEPELLFHKAKISKWKDKHGSMESEKRCSPFLKFVEKQVRGNERLPEDVKISSFVESWFEMDSENKKKFFKRAKKCPDPISSLFAPDVTFASVSEKLDSIIENYIELYHHGLLGSTSSGMKNNILSSKTRISPGKLKDMYYYRAFRSLTEPGEPVGMLAAQSVGEPSTQMTLNTFHFAGRGETNVTLGIPRLREILMTASANIATPTMDLPLFDVSGALEKAEALKVKLSLVSLKQVLESVEIKDVLHIKSKTERYRRYIIRMNFLPYKVYKGSLHATPLSILDYIEQSFIGRIIAVTKKRLASMSQAEIITSMKQKMPSAQASTENGDDMPPVIVLDDNSSSSDGEGDGDTLSTKAKARHNQEIDYDEPEEEEEIIVDAEGDNVENDVAVIEEKSEEEEVVDEEEVVVSKRHVFKKSKLSDQEKSMRAKRVMDKYHCVSNYDCDTKKLQWCEFTLQFSLQSRKLDMGSVIEDEVKKAVVYRVPKIKNAFIVKNPRSLCGKMIKTEGVNFLEIFGVDYVDIINTKQVYSNDIQAVAKMFGIEAARRVIIKEIQNVFATYGIEVDPRHLQLIASYMTYDGTVRPFNRASMSSNSSPLQQMTFETTMNFLQSAVLHASEEQFKSPSSRIVIGKPVAVGTGCTDIFLKPPRGLIHTANGNLIPPRFLHYKPGDQYIAHLSHL